MAFVDKAVFHLYLHKPIAMQSPFPGMDPYLEGHLWPDVHHSLAYLIKAQLAPRVGPAYMVHTRNYMVEDTAPGEDIGIMYPDVEVLHHSGSVRESDAAPAVEITPETIILPGIKPVEVHIPVVEIRDAKHNKFITAIEILSPVNKRKPGLQPYREKRLRLHDAGVHLIEIDLIRRGERPLVHPLIPNKHYMVNLIRAGTNKTQIWAMNVDELLPVIPVPLQHPDADTWLDLGQALKDLYDQRALHKSINYQETPPPPAFTKEEQAWMETVLK